MCNGHNSKDFWNIYSVPNTVLTYVNTYRELYNSYIQYREKELRFWAQVEADLITSLGSSPVAQQVQDPALSLLWLRLLRCMRCVFNPWPRNFHIPWVQPKKKKKKKKKKKSSLVCALASFLASSSSVLRNFFLRKSNSYFTGLM